MPDVFFVRNFPDALFRARSARGDFATATTGGRGGRIKLPHRTAATATALAGKRPAEALQKVEGGEADDEGNEKGFHCFAPWGGKAAWAA